jgi:hypothetical protein
MERVLADRQVDVPLSPQERLRVADAARGTDGLYRDLILAARFFAEQAEECEQSARRAAHNGGSGAATFGVRHRSYVTGAIFSAVGFLDASINELYLEFHTRSSEQAPLPRRVLAVLERFWSHVEHAPLLHRYQVVLTVADAERFDERRAPFLDADSLVRLRDALVHCGPERPESRRRARTIEQRLHDLVSPNPLAEADAPWFPDVCLSAGCADWAVRTADGFSAAFCRRLSLPPRGLERSDAASRIANGVSRSRGVMPNAAAHPHGPNGTSPGTAR